jgi:hypothetical protein
MNLTENKRLEMTPDVLLDSSPDQNIQKEIFSKISEQPVSLTVTMPEGPSLPSSVPGIIITETIDSKPPQFKINATKAQPPEMMPAVLLHQNPGANYQTSAPLNKKIQSVLIGKPQCTCCSELATAEKFYRMSLKMSMDGCKHDKDKDCCCKRKLVDICLKTPDEKEYISTKKINDAEESNFLRQYNSEKDSTV